MKQRVIVVRATGIGGDVRPVRPLNSNTSPCTTRDGSKVSLNGASVPDITIAPGEKQFWRVLNATGHKTLKLDVEGEKLQLVAIDGFALDTYPGTPATETLPYLIVPPAARVEFVVTGPKKRPRTFSHALLQHGSQRRPRSAVASRTSWRRRRREPGAFLHRSR